MRMLPLAALLLTTLLTACGSQPGITVSIGKQSIPMVLSSTSRITAWGAGETGDAFPREIPLTTVSENSQQVGGSLSPGDMWRWPDQHVRLHSSYAGGTGDNMFEASLSWGQQIYYSYRPFTDYTNYFWDACNFAS
jgi:hypothetical protein